MRTEDGYIIYKCLNGDPTAFGFLVDKYKAGVYASAYERLHNFHDAEDIAQEVFFKAYRSLRTLRHWDSFASWLYRITLNLCKDSIRAKSRRPDQEFIEEQDQEVLEAPSMNTYRQELVYGSVQEALDSLPEIYRQVLTLHYFGGMNSAEIARFVGISPSAIRMRLSKARSLLKEEMLDMITTTSEKHRLRSAFTFRILEAVKKIKIHPVPRTTGLPWGLSLATGIIFTVLSFSPQPNMFSRAAIATGSISHDENRVVKTGETSVDIVGIYQVSAPAGEQGDNTGEPELPDSDTSTLAASNGKGGASAQGSTSDDKAIIDPETGVKYVKATTLTGKKDVIDDVGWPLALKLSPNGKFLLWGDFVIPMDEGGPFRLMGKDMPRWSFYWCYLSPNGRKVAFLSEGDIWVIPVSLETGQPTGPAEKLHDDNCEKGQVSWSPDSECIAFQRGDQFRGDICVFSLGDGKVSQITDDPVWESLPVWSPDGKTIAYSAGYELRVIPAESGSPRTIYDKFCHYVSWSPDSKWLIHNADQKLRFFRLADERVFEINPPGEVGTHFDWSPDGSKMLFYRSSYGSKSTLRVAPASGGPSFELGMELTLSSYSQFWSPDGKMVIVPGEFKDGGWGLWIIPLTGDEPFPLELDVSVPGKPIANSLSPDCSKVLFTVYQSDNTKDLWVAPVSLKDGRATGPAVRVFGERQIKHRSGGSCVWSPDGTKLALTHEENIWVVPADGGEPIKVTKGTIDKRWPIWSPDGKTIAYTRYHTGADPAIMVISASGSEAREVSVGEFGNWWKYNWTPDGKELTFLSQERIWAFDPASGKTRQVADLESLNLYAPRYVAHPAWSPDGQKLTFAGNRDRNWHIFMVSAKTGEITQIGADDQGTKLCPYWSPDGKWISYDCDRQSKIRPEGEIWEVDFQELLSSRHDHQ